MCLGPISFRGNLHFWDITETGLRLQRWWRRRVPAYRSSWGSNVWASPFPPWRHVAYSQDLWASSLALLLLRFGRNCFKCVALTSRASL
mmetsp:Transcript_20507/g.48652  ORF Transcript_20507/g.48652 Transcript_20507/m.48652 type:complete len:89 (-) Transcript_20507:358-624(-)